ncbi:PIG-L deacetylase family protein [Streptomyces sp. NPDC058374]|uniref:PIG-L deacetylase family protein n=1 Tax=unclassified Streptomyces TaxID=2593676 RepID=UPI00365AD10F
MSENELAQLPDDWERALVAVAHPDDIEFGAAGAVAAWTDKGKDVAYLLMTRGEAGINSMEPEAAAAARAEEQIAAARIVGVERVEFLDHPDGTIEYGLPLRRDLAASIRRFQPELVVGFNHHDLFGSGKWNTPDHRNAGRALLDAVGDAGNRWIFPELGLEPWDAVKYVAIASSPQPTHAVDITDSLDRAVESLEAHSAYLAALGPRMADVRTPLTQFAKFTGERFGGRPAIAFELLAR